MFSIFPGLFLLFTKKKRKKCEYNIPLEIVFWKVVLFWIFWSIFDPRIFFEGRCHLQACNDSEYLGWKLEWNLPGKSPLSLCLITSCSFFKFSFYFLSQQIWLQCFACSRCARFASFTHIHISILLRILFPCRLWHSLQ